MILIAREGRRHDCHSRVVGKSPPRLRVAVFDPGGITYGRRNASWIEGWVMVKNISDIQVDSRQISTGVEILLKMSHKTLTSAEENIQ
jgi:hypothetical protein